MKLYALSDKGKYRAENQDSFDLCEIQNGAVAVICDGMGGEAAGLTASSMTAARFLSAVRMSIDTQDGTSTEDAMRLAADSANRKVFRYACEHDEYRGMGTTIVAVCTVGDTAVFLNVGDSRAYRIAKDGITQITRDHSLVQEMVIRGQITQEQARRHPKRNIITRAVGVEPFVTSDIFTVSIRPEDRFLLCTDGLSGTLSDAELHRLILAAETPRSACEALISAALENNARDNITACVIFPEIGGLSDGT